jgi:hypothetical protein
MLQIDETKTKIVGQNLSYLRVGDTLVLLVDTTKAIGPSASGKMLGVASTNGFTVVEDGLKLNLYLGKRI